MRVNVRCKVNHCLEFDRVPELGTVTAHIGALLDSVCNSPDLRIFLELAQSRGNGAVIVKVVWAVVSRRVRAGRRNVIVGKDVLKRGKAQRAPVEVRRGDGHGHIAQAVVLFGVQVLLSRREGCVEVGVEGEHCKVGCEVCLLRLYCLYICFSDFIIMRPGLIGFLQVLAKIRA